MRKLNESKLPYKEIDNLNDQLAGALNNEKKMENYLNEVNAHLVKFRQQQKIAKREEGKCKREKCPNLISSNGARFFVKNVVWGFS
jgi:chromosome segregation ATPase